MLKIAALNLSKNNEGRRNLRAVLQLAGTQFVLSPDERQSIRLRLLEDALTRSTVPAAAGVGCDIVKLSNDAESGLMVKVRTLTLNFLMFPRRQFDRLASTIASLIGAARDATLSHLQFFLRCPVVFWVLDYLTRAQLSGPAGRQFLLFLAVVAAGRSA